LIDESAEVRDGGVGHGKMRKVGGRKSEAEKKIEKAAGWALFLLSHCV
jgi:hypothetical protein